MLFSRGNSRRNPLNNPNQTQRNNTLLKIIAEKQFPLFSDHLHMHATKLPCRYGNISEQA